MSRSVSNLSQVLLLFACFTLTSCFRDKEAEMALAEENRKMGDELENLKRELIAIGDESSKLRDEISDYESKRRNLKLYQRQELEVGKEMVDVKNYKMELETTLRALEDGIEEWKAATRDSFKGLKLPSFSTVDGTPLSDPIVVEVKDEGIQFAEGDAIKFVEFEKLPKTMRERFADESLIVQDSNTKASDQ
ncbi:MAG: hypothetical protein KDN18_14935 [Verrucomicrobiae bacterium]|nr:hypothetical protein [Verrucomicrobiae bacterium]